MRLAQGGSVLIAHPVFDGEKPNPVTETMSPGGPKLGDRVIVGTDVTVKTADAASAGKTSGVAVIVYGVGGTFDVDAILKPPDKTPAEIVQDTSEIVKPAGFAL
jgi:hypothetical protein